MLIVDASALYEVLVGTTRADGIRQRMHDDDLAAPHLVDAEVLGVIRSHLQRGLLDRTAADQAVDDLGSWPADRYSHGPLLERAWELRDTVRSWDALYVALAEALDATLLTCDARLAAASGPRCSIEVV